ncbi:MAG: DNA repair protein RecN [Betaproteobacteria bacterium]|nr:DNA repair protein RecN [Betaproteobacteria bacterium]
MLLALTVQDFVIVDHLRMEFPRGFTVLTGETGAGKSILVDAMLLVLGGRGDAGVVRAGRERAEIVVEFDIRDVPAVRQLIADMEIAIEDDLCILRRLIDSGGRSRAFVNGRAVPVSQLREIGEHLVDVHGQHEHQSLMRPNEQRGLLDAYAGAEGLAADVARAYAERLAAERAWNEARSGADAAAADRDRLEWQVNELRELALEPGEWDDIQAEHERLAHAATLISGTESGAEILGDGDGAVASVVASVASQLRSLADHDKELAPVVELVDSAEIQIKEATYALRHYRQRIDLDPGRLQELETRIEAIVTLARKHRVAPEALSQRRAELESQLATVSGRLDLDALEASFVRADAAYRDAARRLTAARRTGARALGKAVTEAMQSLAMGGGKFSVDLHDQQEPASYGLEQVEFRMAAHPGVPPAPVAKVASGGELARLSLAIQTVTSRIAPVPTLVFDEVDSGIGGGVAEIVGRMLRDLGAGRQVFCITHLPQVAAAAPHQWRVSKQVRGHETRSVVEELPAAARVEEIARMLGGVEITETTRGHAAEMLSRFAV